MNSVIKELKVFVAEDGKEFINEEDCSKYENGTLKDKKNIRYYIVRCNPDLTETGCMMSEIPVAVLSVYGCHANIVVNWCVKEKNMPIIGEGVQGYGLQDHFQVNSIRESDYFSSVAGKKTVSGCYAQERVFLSPKNVEGFPACFNYMKKWNLK